MHRVLIILTLTFIQVHTDLNQEDNKCLIISETIQVCCENCLTKGLYDHCQSDDRDRHSRSQYASPIGLLFNLQYLGQYLRYYIHTWHAGRFMDARHDHTRLDDLDLVARSQWVDKGKQ